MCIYFCPLLWSLTPETPTGVVSGETAAGTEKKTCDF